MVASGRMWAYRALLVAVVFAAFSPVFFAGFLNWDDPQFIYQNSAVLSFDLGRMFTQTVLGLYIPLTSLSFSIEKAIFGLTPFVFHLNNVLLHTAVSVLLMGFFMQLGAGARAAFLGALVFAVHPMHVESVAWVTERKDVLYALFYILALRQWVVYLDERKTKGLVLTFVLGCLSLLAKPMAVSLPLVMFFMECWRTGSIRRVRLAPYLPMFMAAVLIGYVTYAQQVRNPVGDLGVSGLIWVWTFGFYIWKFFLPFVFNPAYALPTPVSFFHPAYAFSVVLFFALAGGLWYRVAVPQGGRDRWVLWAAGFFFLSIFFLLRFDAGDTHVVADRFMYLPSAGICLWLGIQADKAVTRYGRKAAFIIAGVVLLLALRTFSYAGIWKDSVTLWSYVIDRYPKKEIAYNNRAVAYGEMGQYDLAIADHSTVLTFPSNRALALYNRALNYRDWAKEKIRAGERAQAERLYRSALTDLDQALRFDPGYARAYDQRAMVRYYFKDEAGALEDLNKAVEIDPRNLEVFNNRGNMRAAKGELDLALNDYRRALELGANGPEAYNNIGIIYARKGHTDLALESFNKAISIDPRHGQAYFNRSVIERQKGDLRSALADVLRARTLGAAFNEDYLRSLQAELKN